MTRELCYRVIRQNAAMYEAVRAEQEVLRGGHPANERADARIGPDLLTGDYKNRGLPKSKSFQNFRLFLDGH